MTKKEKKKKIDLKWKKIKEVKLDWPNDRPTDAAGN